MSDEKNKTGGGEDNSGASSGNSGNTNTGNDIPYVPPQDRTNLNESRDFDTKPVVPPSIKKEE